ncbi:MAG TPA: aldehyde-activating protein [Sphingomonas sp.]
MLKLSCLCGQVRIEVAKRPDFINECNCTLCSKSGARWSYFHPSEVGIKGMTRQYRRKDKDDPAAEVHFCGSCGSTTHFTLTESAILKFGNVQMGVNMLLANESDLAGIELRYPDGRAWSGGTDFGYVREARIIGQNVASQ